MSFLDPDLIADETVNAESALAGVAEMIPGWEAAEGHVETAMAESWGAALATAISVLVEEVRNAYAGLGRILGIERVEASPASATAIWTFDVSPGVIPAGTELTVTDIEGNNYAFATIEDVAVEQSLTAITTIQAVDPGPEPNGAGSDATTDQLADVNHIILQDVASGGADEEEFQAYLDRIVDAARRLRRLPITPEDFSAMALDVAGVYRAYAFNRLDPAVPSADSPGHVTVYAVTREGEPLPPGTDLALINYFNTSEHVMGAVVHVAAPNYVDLAINVSAQAHEGYSPEVLRTEILDALSTAFGPSRFGLDENVPGRWAHPDTQVSVYRAAAAIDDLQGLRSITSITVNGAASAQLPGPLSLPRFDAVASTITVV